MPYQMWVEDNRIKRVNFPHLPYPYTVEYTVKTKKKGLMHYPIFSPQDNNRTAVQSAVFDVTVAKDMKPLRFKSLNGMGEPNVANIESGTRYVWTMSKIKAFASEPYTPSVSESLPRVWIAPTEFRIDNFDGDMTSWENYGNFLKLLNQNRQTISPEKKAFLVKLVADCPDVTCKVERVYKHLQETTRYFSIQLGIGGWQPFLATDVEKRKYSDCKGLSNYMVAMLAAIGVDARYVIIRAGAEAAQQFEDFPNAYFNHAIACVPTEKDTIWLECTSQSEVCGYSSSFTGNRKALLVTPEGGKFVNTPTYDEHTNFATTSAKITLNTEGVASAKVTFNHTGIQQDNLAFYEEKSTEEKKKHLQELFQLNNASISEFTFIRQKTRIPCVKQEFNAEIMPLASKSGKRLFVPLNVFSKFDAVPVTDSTRRFAVKADDFGFTERDTLSFILPEGFKTESKINPLSISSIFGSFNMTVVEKSPTELMFYRQFVLNSKTQPKEKFGELVDFLQKLPKPIKLS
ncbi:MAG: DUF3857 domain-containing protein [Saprospiraceae bacterium]|nr:DUF3857 domain-containing protein [Saprospiraceae bacterium]